MFRILTALNSFLGILLGFAIVALLSLAGWFGWTTYHKDKWELRESQEKLKEQESTISNLNQELAAGKQRIQRLNQDLEVKQREIERLDTAVRLLKVDHRVGRIAVLGQQGSAEAGDLTTKFSFVELGQGGKPLDEPRVFTIKGDIVYLDAWVIKFADEKVETNDPLRSTSVCLFRRLFGEAQQPKEGFVLDQVGSQPAVYRGAREPSDLEREIWSQFWEYANDTAKAKKAGVRAAHGEAPSIKLVPGKRYKVLLRASGGLTIIGDDDPPSTTGDVF